MKIFEVFLLNRIYFNIQEKTQPLTC